MKQRVYTVFAVILSSISTAFVMMTFYGPPGVTQQDIECVSEDARRQYEEVFAER